MPDGSSPCKRLLDGHPRKSYASRGFFVVPAGFTIQMHIAFNGKVRWMNYYISLVCDSRQCQPLMTSRVDPTASFSFALGIFGPMPDRHKGILSIFHHSACHILVYYSSHTYSIAFSTTLRYNFNVDNLSDYRYMPTNCVVRCEIGACIVQPWARH